MILFNAKLPTDLLALWSFCSVFPFAYLRTSFLWYLPCYLILLQVYLYTRVLLNSLVYLLVKYPLGRSKLLLWWGFIRGKLL